MALYLDGYKSGEWSGYSWAIGMFFPKNQSLPLNVKLTYKQIKEVGFDDWLGREAPKMDYYIAREY